MYTRSMQPLLRGFAVFIALLIMTAGAVGTIGVSPAEARSYTGTWKDSMYVAPKGLKKRAYSKSRSYSKKKGYTSKTRKTRKTGKRYAALGRRANDATPYRKSVTGGGGGIRWAANSGCLSGSLRSVIGHVAANYGPVTVSSTCRSKGRNRAVGGAKKSYHLSGSAADFRVHRNSGAAYAYLRSSGSVGGLKHYGGGLFHIDTGPRRRF